MLSFTAKVKELATVSRSSGGADKERSNGPRPQGVRTGAGTLPRKPAKPGDKLAAIDLGTNNCRLLIAEVLPGRQGFRVIDSYARIVRLGEGLLAKGELGREPIRRAIEALSTCAGKIEDWGVTRRWAVTTEACRRARNGKAFIARVKEATGLTLDIITPEREVQLAVKGCTSLLDPNYESALLFDIGGGSTELAWLVRNGDGRFRVAAWGTLALGVVTLADGFGGREVSAETYEAMIAHVLEALTAVRPPEALRGLFESERCHHVGTSGTVTTLAGVHLDLARYDRSRIDGIWLTREELADAGVRLRDMSYDVRAAHPCIGPDRADLVIAGYAILDAIQRMWPSERLRVADRGLREGMLMSLAKGTGRRRSRRAKPAADRRPAPLAESAGPPAE